PWARYACGARPRGGARPPPRGPALIRGDRSLACGGGRSALTLKRGRHPPGGSRRARVSERVDPCAGVLCCSGSGATALASTSRGGAGGRGGGEHTETRSSVALPEGGRTHPSCPPCA